MEGSILWYVVSLPLMKSTKKIIVKESAKEPSFEQAIQRLEKVVAEMEGAELPLEDILKKYEEGSRLVRFCSQKLEEAEKKIELLTKKSDGSVSLKPFQPEDESEDAASEEETPEDKEAKLF
jgi:exodeoxyribonuclease VII small subunit